MGTPTAAAPITSRIEGGVATITLDCAPARNAIDAAGGDALIAAIDRVVTAPGLRAVLLRAEGQMFCPGASMDFLQPDAPGMDARIDALLTSLNPALARLAECPAVIVAAVHGAVAGGGLGLMNLADLVIAAEGTKFSLAYTRIGGTPDLGAAWYLPRLVGERRALELLLLSDVFDAERAREIGLVNFVVPAAELARESTRLVERLAAGPAGAHAAVKRLVHRARNGSLPDLLDAERAEIVAAARGPEFAEGVCAFVERRAPRFGRGNGRDA